MSKTEFFAVARTTGADAAVYLAAALGVCRALIEIWEKEI